VYIFCTNTITLVCIGTRLNNPHCTPNLPRHNWEAKERDSMCMQDTTPSQKHDFHFFLQWAGTGQAMRWICPYTTTIKLGVLKIENPRDKN
jgi:hypothetical protein